MIDVFFEKINFLLIPSQLKMISVSFIFIFVGGFVWSEIDLIGQMIFDFFELKKLTNNKYMNQIRIHSNFALYLKLLDNILTNERIEFKKSRRWR